MEQSMEQKDLELHKEQQEELERCMEQEKQDMDNKKR